MTTKIDAWVRMGPAIVWCVLVLGGVAFLVVGHRKDAPGGPVPARHLPTNTLLLPGDLTQPGFTGRYIVAPKGVDPVKALQRSDVADRPTWSAASPAQLLLRLQVPWTTISSGINAGSSVQLCGKAPPTFGTVTVQWIRCGEPGASCAAFIEIPSTAAAKIAAEGLKDQASTSELHLATTCG